MWSSQECKCLGMQELMPMSSLSLENPEMVSKWAHQAPSWQRQVEKCGTSSCGPVSQMRLLPIVWLRLFAALTTCRQVPARCTSSGVQGVVWSWTACPEVLLSYITLLYTTLGKLCHLPMPQSLSLNQVYTHELIVGRLNRLTHQGSEPQAVTL